MRYIRLRQVGLLCGILVSLNLMGIADAALTAKQPIFQFGAPAPLTLSPNFSAETSHHFFFGDHPTSASHRFGQTNDVQAAQDLFVLGNESEATCQDRTTIFAGVFASTTYQLKSELELSWDQDQKATYPTLCQEILQATADALAICQAPNCDPGVKEQEIFDAKANQSCVDLGKVGVDCNSWKTALDNYCETIESINHLAKPDLCQSATKQMLPYFGAIGLCGPYTASCGGATSVSCKAFGGCLGLQLTSAECVSQEDSCLFAADPLLDAAVKAAAIQDCHDLKAACDVKANNCLAYKDLCEEELMACAPFATACTQSAVYVAHLDECQAKEQQAPQGVDCDAIAKDACAMLIIDFVKDGPLTCTTMGFVGQLCAGSKPLCADKVGDAKAKCEGLCGVLTAPKPLDRPLGRLVPADVQRADPGTISVDGTQVGPYLSSFPGEFNGWQMTAIPRADGSMQGVAMLLNDPTTALESVQQAAQMGGGNAGLSVEGLGAVLHYLEYAEDPAGNHLAIHSSIVLNGGTEEPLAKDGTPPPCYPKAVGGANPLTEKELFQKGCLKEQKTVGIINVDFFTPQDIVILNANMPSDLGDGPFVTVYTYVGEAGGGYAPYRYKQFVGPFEGFDLLRAATSADRKSLYLAMNGTAGEIYHAYRLFVENGVLTQQKIPLGSVVEWGGLGPFDIAIRDLNGDGKDDIVHTLARPPTPKRQAIYSPSIYVYLSQADGTFIRNRYDAPPVDADPLGLTIFATGASETANTLSSISAVAIHDFQHDGFPEIIAGDHTPYDNNGRLVHAYIYTNTQGFLDSLTVQNVQVNHVTSSTMRGVCELEVDRYGNIGALMKSDCYPPLENLQSSSSQLKPVGDPQGACPAGMNGVPLGGLAMGCCADLDGDGLSDTPHGYVGYKTYPELSLDDKSDLLLKMLLDSQCGLDNCDPTVDAKFCTGPEDADPAKHKCYNPAQADANTNDFGDVCEPPLPPAP